MSSLKKGLDKQKMHRSGDVIVYKKDTTFGQTKEFDAQIQIIGIPNEIKIGHSITTGRLIFELGSIPEREPEKLKAEDDRLGKSSFAFAFCMDRQKEERERGVIIACTTEEFSTEKLHFTNIDAPGHCDFIKNMITGTSQALIMVPCDENFTIAIAKRNHKVGEIQGQTHQHSRLINLLGVKQIAIGCNKMDCTRLAKRSPAMQRDEEHVGQGRLEEGSGREPGSFLTYLWLDGRQSLQDTRLQGCGRHRNGVDVDVNGTKVNVDTLYDVLNNVCRVPECPISANMRMPTSGICKIKGVGDVLAGRVEQGLMKPGEVIFLPTYTSSNDRFGKIFTVEML